LEWYRYDLQGTPTFYDANNSIKPGGTTFNVRHLFTGQQWYSELGLYDLRNRFYSPDLGRFLQSDPIGFGGGDSNFYRYCGNNPANSADPSGLDVVPPKKNESGTGSGDVSGYDNVPLYSYDGGRTWGPAGNGAGGDNFSSTNGSTNGSGSSSGGNGTGAGGGGDIGGGYNGPASYGSPFGAGTGGSPVGGYGGSLNNGGSAGAPVTSGVGPSGSRGGALTMGVDNSNGAGYSPPRLPSISKFLGDFLNAPPSAADIAWTTPPAVSAITDKIAQWGKDHLSLDLNVNTPSIGGNVNVNSTGVNGSLLGGPGGIGEASLTLNANFGNPSGVVVWAASGALGDGLVARTTFGYSSGGGMFVSFGGGFGAAAYGGIGSGVAGTIHHW
jgi:RHS repeat-associated protein